MGDQPIEKLRALRGAFGVGRGVGPCSIFRPRLFAEFYNSLGNMERDGLRMDKIGNCLRHFELSYIRLRVPSTCHRLEAPFLWHYRIL